MSCAPSPLRSTPLAATHGSTSLLGYTVPGWAATLSAVQPANGEAPETCCNTPTVEVDPHAVEPNTKLEAASATTGLTGTVSASLPSRGV